MPELPDITVYVRALRSRVVGERLDRIRLHSPFLLRSVEPPLSAASGRRVLGVRRLDKRLVFDLDGDLHLLLHLMIAGRLRWMPPGSRPPGRRGLAAFDFDPGTLVLTEAGTKKRAALHLVAGEDELARHDRGGLEVLDSDRAAFARSLTRERHTLKRALTDQRILSGIGNAYSDEILHRARLSPVRLTSDLAPAEIDGLWKATRAVLQEWIDRLIEETGDRFPDRVTAFRDGMAVHGRYRRPCPDCGSPVQRIVYASRETNYCAGCQTGGRLLADRALSRLLKGDWPKNPDDLEARLEPAPSSPSSSGRRRGSP